MALKLIVDKLEDVEEVHRPLYAEKDGKFVLAVEGIEDTTGLKRALESERKTARELEKQTKRWKELGKSPDEIGELIEAANKAEEDKAKHAGDWDKLKAQMNQKHADEIKAKDSEIAKGRTALEKYLIDSAATQAIAEAKGAPALLLPHVRSSVKVIEDGGNYSVRVVDVKGDPRVNGKGEFLSIADLVGEMRQSEVFGRAFEGTGQSGSGTQPINAGGAGANRGGVPKSWAEAKTPEEKAAFLKHQAAKEAA